MKRINIIILCLLSFVIGENEKGFKLLNTSNNNYQVQFDLEEFEIERNNEFDKIKVISSVGNTGVIGMPKLPSFSSLLMVDPTKDYDLQYTVKDSYIIDDVKIAPNQHLVNGLEREQVLDIDSEFYNSDDKYPLENFILSEPMVFRDLVLLNISIVPFNYFPNSNQLEVISLIEFNIIETSQHADIRTREMPRSEVFEKLYQNQIINYTSEHRDDEYQLPSILYICSSNIESNGSFQQLVDWRTERGYHVHTASLSETGSSASSIKNYIQNAYQSFNPPPEYVALIGDVGGSYSIPTYYEDYGHDSYGNECEGDLPYSQLDGNDLFPEVLIGRMSIRSTSELSAAVSKIINYEKATYLGSLGDYFESAAMAGDPSSSGNSCAITKENVKEQLEAHGFSNVDIKTSGSSWSSWMQDRLNDGVLYFNYRGYLGMSGFDNNDVDNANNGYKLPFATVLTCGTGSFAEDQTSMSEKFFRAGSSTTPKGGVAAIGTATWNTHTLFNNIVDMGIYNGLLSDKVGTAGAALASGKLALYNAYSNDPYQWINAFTQWNNLIGDPATHLWTDTPNVLNVTHESEIPYGTNYLDILVADSFGNPEENARITIIVRNAPISIFTDNLGYAQFEFDSFSSGNTLITVTKQNYKPYQGYVNISDDNYSVNVDFSSELVISDSNNNVPEAGESFGISIPIKNYGNQTVNGVVATLSSTSNLVSLDDEVISYGNIISGSSVYGENFNIVVSPSAIQAEDLKLIIHITDDQSNNWTSVIDVVINGTLLVASNSINLQPGQTSNVDIELTNFGLLSASGVSAELSYTGNLLIINDSFGSWADISSGQASNSNNDFNLTLSNDIINGSQIVLNLHIQTEDGYDRISTVNLVAGNVSVSDPFGPDQHGYYIYDSGDSDYGFAPSYNWIEIDPSNGGSGTDLNLSDSGNGNWSGNGPIETVELPFDFTFYGITYNEITICTNGWIALGDSDMESFRNYPIPGPGGPSPMIAAFWDDLETSNSGNVYYKEYNDYVVVEWSEMRTQNNNSLETFQVILYDNAVQPYGDSEIKIQYKEFNNTSSGSFSSYPPIHGAYATIGIENHFANDGLQYTFLNQYPTAAMTLSDNTALFITTQPPVTLPAPELNYSYNNLNFELTTNQMQTGSLFISNAGEEGSLLSYSVYSSYPEMDSPFDVSGGGPDTYGFYWTDSDISNELDYNWIDILDNNEQVSFINNDDGTELMDIGFDFSFYGEDYSQFLINPNGWIGFEDDTNSWHNGNIPALIDIEGDDVPKAAIFGFWDDLNPVNDNCNSSCSGNVFYQRNTDYLVVWFDNVYHWASEGFENSYYDFQIVIHSNGEININHRTIEGIYSATVGLQNSTGTVASQVDQYNGDYFGNNVSFKFIRPYIPDWLSIDSESVLSGELADNQNIEVFVHADATEISSGTFSATITLSTNAQNDIEIPVTLSIIEDAGIIGDLNGDEYINVADIIILVSLILDEGDYQLNADFNQDGIVNVIDVVNLVNYILYE